LRQIFGGDKTAVLGVKRKLGGESPAQAIDHFGMMAEVVGRGRRQFLGRPLAGAFKGPLDISRRRQAAAPKGQSRNHRVLTLKTSV